MYCVSVLCSLRCEVCFLGCVSFSHLKLFEFQFCPRDRDRVVAQPVFRCSVWRSSSAHVPVAVWRTAGGAVVVVRAGTVNC